MGLFEHFPYVNTHNINLDWIISKVKGLSDKVDSFEHSAIPTGGSTGQALVKNSDEDYDAKWATVVGERGPQGPQGLQGPEGPQGPQGVPGADGQGFVIVGQYDTFDEFMEEHWAIHEDDVGTAYYIGEEGDEDYYILLGTYIQYQEGRGLGWLNIGQIKGQKGDTGAQGPQGPQGNPGADGVGIPEGGSTGQVLAKASGSDYDTEWVDAGSGEESIGGTYFVCLYSPQNGTADIIDTSSLSPRQIRVPYFMPLETNGGTNGILKIESHVMMKDLNDTENAIISGSIYMELDDGNEYCIIDPEYSGEIPFVRDNWIVLNTKGIGHAQDGEVFRLKYDDDTRAIGNAMKYGSTVETRAFSLSLPQTTQLQIGFSYLKITIC